MATVWTIEENGRPIAVVSMDVALTGPALLAAQLREGEWLSTALTEHAGWDCKSPITARVPTSLELGAFERNVLGAKAHGAVDLHHHIALLAEAPPKSPKPAKRAE